MKKRNGDEKLHIINSQIRSMERKEFDALSSIKASFYAQKNYSRHVFQRKDTE